jgi:hypothetical protein
MRLFRQNASRDWSDVVAQVRTELHKVVAGWSPAKRTVGAD